MINWTVELNHVGCQHIVQLGMDKKKFARSCTAEAWEYYLAGHHRSALSGGQVVSGGADEASRLFMCVVVTEKQCLMFVGPTSVGKGANFCARED